MFIKKKQKLYTSIFRIFIISSISISLSNCGKEIPSFSENSIGTNSSNETDSSRIDNKVDAITKSAEHESSDAIASNNSDQPSNNSDEGSNGNNFPTSDINEIIENHSSGNNNGTNSSENESVSEETDTKNDPAPSEEEEDTDEVFTTSISLGIGFEDSTDNDYNDMTLCFDGKFKVDLIEGVIISLADQELPVFYKRISGNPFHKMYVYNGRHGHDSLLTVEGLNNYESGSENLKFHKDQVFRVVLNNNLTIKSNKTKVESDRCRTTGS